MHLFFFSSDFYVFFLCICVYNTRGDAHKPCGPPKGRESLFYLVYGRTQLIVYCLSVDIYLMDLCVYTLLMYSFMQYYLARVCRINIHKYICYCMRPLVGNTYTVHTEVSKINPFFWPAATAKTATFTFVLMPDRPVRYKR